MASLRIGGAAAAIVLCASLALAQDQGFGARIAAGAASIDSADPAERRLAKAMAVYNLVMPPGRFTTILQAMRPGLEQSMRDEAAALGRAMPPDAPDRLFRIMSEEMSAMMDRAGERVAPVYAEALTEAELDALLSLYSSPEGRALLDKLPRISAQASLAMQGDIETMNQRVISRMQRELGIEAPAGGPRAVFPGLYPGGVSPTPSRAPDAQ